MTANYSKFSFTRDKFSFINSKQAIAVCLAVYLNLFRLFKLISSRYED